MRPCWIAALYWLEPHLSPPRGGATMSPRLGPQAAPPSHPPHQFPSSNPFFPHCPLSSGNFPSIPKPEFPASGEGWMQIKGVQKARGNQSALYPPISAPPLNSGTRDLSQSSLDNYEPPVQPRGQCPGSFGPLVRAASAAAAADATGAPRQRWERLALRHSGASQPLRAAAFQETLAATCPIKMSFFLSQLVPSLLCWQSCVALVYTLRRE